MMTPRRKQRLIMVLLLVTGVSAATAVAVVTLKDNVRFALTPSEVHSEQIVPERQFRLAGLVAENSVRRDADSLQVSFRVTDRAAEVPVSYEGILPDLFREGQAVIAHGYLDSAGRFTAHEVLARHDETYEPPEVTRALEQAAQ